MAFAAPLHDLSPVRVIVINTGTELLLGDVVNSHLSFIAREIFPLHLRVEQQLAVPDGMAIRDALAENFARAEIIFVTGGLGPTTDDVTREITAQLLGLDLVFDPAIATSITERLRSRAIRLTDRVLRQAQVPRGAEVLPNEYGSAPGLYLAANLNPPIATPHLFLLPGPPRELQPMFREAALPILKRIVRGNESIGYCSYRIVGMGESYVEEAVGPALLELPGLELGYCARMGEVDLRVIGPATVLEEANAIVRARLTHYIISTEGENLETVIVRELAAHHATLAVAESCTGGFLAHRLTNVPGASEIFVAGYVTYSNKAKISALGVPADLIAKHGAVSKAVARAMAEGARNKSGADYALSVTGIAGPAGGSVEKPVGTAYLALADGGKTVVRHLFFPTDRETFKQLTTQMALNLLRGRLLVRPS